MPEPNYLWGIQTSTREPADRRAQKTLSDAQPEYAVTGTKDVGFDDALAWESPRAEPRA